MPSTSGLPLTRREVRARERLRLQQKAEREAKPQTERGSQVFDIEEFESGQPADSAARPGRASTAAAPAPATGAKPSVPAAPTSPAARALLGQDRPGNDANGRSRGADVTEPRSSAAAPVPARAHAQNYFDLIAAQGESKLSDMFRSGHSRKKDEAQEPLNHLPGPPAGAESEDGAVRRARKRAAQKSATSNAGASDAADQEHTHAGDTAAAADATAAAEAGHAEAGHADAEGHHTEPHHTDSHQAELHHAGLHHGEAHDEAHDEEDPDLEGRAFEDLDHKPAHHRRVRGWVAVVLALLLLGGGSFAGYQALAPIFGWNKIKDYSGPGGENVALDIESGASVSEVGSQLEKLGVVADKGTFVNSFQDSGVTLSPGSYTFRKEMSSADAVQVLGHNGAKVAYVALSAGLRVGESLDAIAKGTGVQLADLQKLNKEPAQFGLPPEAKNLEGYLFPGEYRFAEGSSAKDILSQLVKGTKDELVSQGITDPSEQYTKITIASIVQAEAGRADYPTVAGAIMNRLKPNDETVGYVQSDATVTYGLGRKSYELTPGEKADKSNLYNTYAHQGLPVGPIGSPGKLAVDAAAKPKSSDYLYWVTINLDSGETRFAKTLAEHNQNVTQYQFWCQANAGRCQ